MHEAASAEDFEHQTAEVTANCLDQSNGQSIYRKSWRVRGNITVGLLTSVCVKADSRVEAFSMFQYVESQRHLNAVTFVLDSLQRSLQAEPETDLLQRCARRRVAVQLRHLTQ